MANFFLSVFFCLITSISFAQDLKIISNSSTGGNATYIRLFIKHASKYMNGNIVFKIVPGAGGVSAANYLYNFAAKDGSEIGILTSTVFIQGNNNSIISYNLQKFNWLGSFTDNRQDPYIFWSNSKGDIISGSESGFGINHINILNKVLKWNIKEIIGYRDSTQVKLAFERNEINLIVYTLGGIKITNPDWLLRDDIFLMIQYGNGLNRHKDLLNVPTAAELVMDENDKKFVLSFENLLVLSKAITAPPGVCKTRLGELRLLFDNVVNDVEFRKEAETIRLSINPIHWRETEEIVKSMNEASFVISSKLKL